MSQTFQLPRNSSLGLKGAHNTTVYMGPNSWVDLYGNGKNNMVIGSSGHDSVYASTQINTTVLGLGGADYLFVSGRGSVADGGVGNDKLIGGDGSKLIGGAGKDTFGFDGSDGVVKVADLKFAQGDKLDLTGIGSWDLAGEFHPAHFMVDGNALEADWTDPYGVQHTLEIRGVGNAITHDGGLEASIAANHVIIRDGGWGGGKG